MKRLNRESVASSEPSGTSPWLVERARVVDTFRGGVWVEAQQQMGCSGCAAQGCGRGLLARWRRPARLALRTEAALSIGDEVRVGVPDTGFLYSALVIYGWPLLAALLMGGLAEQLVPVGHVTVPLSFLAGLALGMIASRWQLRRNAHRYSPVLLVTAA